ncbi:hypothetical protein NEF87_003845 [Candidatus Lokiarchaeum ossiferum]|uniref:Leucine-rich repeat domain-containing protein n=1 Tax=Candidatus Lokiarchaeum ossiferum TaxID=2951803 RepID=A0ABY6HVK8_9ARCH|nr:hypothetical protein NEF87_003845 [Candidatus Lokiarchaeum sp. B-35]
MGDYTSKHQFIRSDVFLIAHVDPESRKQSVIMQLVDNQSGDIIQEEKIDCIHLALSTSDEIPWSEENDPTDLEEAHIFSESSEDKIVDDLTMEDIFQALNSWVAGIAEMGEDAFKIQADIENQSQLGIPLSNRLLRFMSLIDVKYLYDFLDQIATDCNYEGKRHDSCLIANLIPVLETLHYIPEEYIPSQVPDIYDDPNHPKFPFFEEIVIKIFQMDPPIELFLESVDYTQLLQQPAAVTLTDFRKGFSSKHGFLRTFIAKNPKAPSFKEYIRFLSEITEPDPKVRKSAARSEGAPRFSEFGNFFSIETESDAKVREAAANNPLAPIHPQFWQSLSLEHENELHIHRLALNNLLTSKNPSYKALYAKLQSIPTTSIKEIEFLLELQDQFNLSPFDESFMDILTFEGDEPENQLDFTFTSENGHITTIRAKNCGLHKIPASIKWLHHLQEIDLTGNPIQNVTTELQSLPNLIIHF